MTLLLLFTNLATAGDEAAPKGLAPAVRDALWLRGYGELRGTWTDADGEPGTAVERLRPTFGLDVSPRLSLQLTPELALEQGRYPPAELERALREQVGDFTLDALIEAYNCDLQTERTIDEVGDVLTLERVFVDLTLPAVDLRLGRQAMNWGSALIFNPTDVFAEVIVAEPWRERAGVDALRATVPIGERAQILAVGGFSDITSGDWQDWRAGLRGTLSLGPADLSLVGFAKRDQTFAGLDLKGDLGVGWWLEGGWDGDLKLSAGLDYSFPVLQVLYIAGQVSYDGSGSAPEDYDYSARMSGGEAVATCDEVPEDFPLDVSGGSDGEARSTLGRLYAVAVLRWTLDDAWSVSGTALWNLEDGTGLLFPSATALVGDRVSLNAGVQVLAGKDGEFRPSPSDLQVQDLDLSGLLPTWTALGWVRTSF